MVQTKNPKIIVAEDGKKYTFDEVATYVKYHAPNATQEEIEEFFNYCKVRNLNPYDVHFIKYGNEEKVIVVGKDAFLKRAERSKTLSGYKAGVIVIDENGKIIHREGAFYIPSKEKLVGGWAEVYRKDYKIPIRVEVSFEEYCKRTRDGKPFKSWAQMPATMIRKVALVQALREAFPNELSGMYIPEEMGVEVDNGSRRLDVYYNGSDSHFGNSDSVVDSGRITEQQIRTIKTLASKVWQNLTKEEISFNLKQLTKSMFNKESSKQLTKEEADRLIETLKELSQVGQEVPAEQNSEQNSLV